MFSSIELIEALRKRARPSLRPEPEPGAFPPGWQAWFIAMGERIGAITGASAEAIVAIFVQREPAAPPRRVGELNRWQSFATLWRQQWQPVGREGRGDRIIASAITFVLHLFLLVILLWLGSIPLLGTAAPQGEDVVQVEYIGTGTPEDTGGGAPSGEPQEQVAPAAASPAPAASAAAASAVQPLPAATTPTFAPPQPQPPAPAQPLAVTQVATPDTPFVLSQTNPQVVEIPRPAPETPQLQAPNQQVEVDDTPRPVHIILQMHTPKIPVTSPQLAQRPTEITLRQAPVPLPGVQTRALPEQPVRALSQALPGVRELPMPAAASATATAAAANGSTPASSAARGNQASGAAPNPGGQPAPGTGTQPNATAAGSARAPNAKPGASPSPQRGDDWGASTRNRPGGNTGKQPGLFNADGSPRLGGQPAPDGGLPPGAITQDIANLDRVGTWLKRKPNDFEPTGFDKYWVPNETLLEEWVRKSIREVYIPIPGTSKRLHCVVSLLQLAGGCLPDDANMQDQEATARPPPDIPFKPELQDDQGTLRKPP